MPWPWTAEEREVLDTLKARAGVPTDDALISLALFRLAAWYDIWPSAEAFAIGFVPAPSNAVDVPRRKRGAK